MASVAPFKGFSGDTYRFLMEIGFNNEKAFLDANRQRYYDGVRDPLRALAMELIPTALEIDPGFNTRLTGVVSRLNRDTRFSKNKLPYRDHAWLSFKHVGESIGESFGLYFEIQPGGYGYGMGLYAPNTQFMEGFRARMLANPAAFMDYAAPVEKAGLALEGDMYKRDRFPGAPDALKPYLNRRSLGWSFFSPSVARTLEAGLKDDLEDAFMLMKPLYRLLAGLEL